MRLKKNHIKVTEWPNHSPLLNRKSMEGDLSCQAAARKPKGFREFLQRGVSLNSS